MRSYDFGSLKGALTMGFFCLLGLSACVGLPNDHAQKEATREQAAPAAPREFRAAWVATVANIDWPSRKDLTSVQQQAEMLAILDNAVQLKLNALILQVRPSADAIYPSALEPWSEYLTGTQGKAPAPAYDPLQMWVEQAHARGLELHAWFNPYRAKAGPATSALAPNHISRTAPAAVKQYGDLLWMDPAEPAAARQTLAVIMDVVRRYDIDGVHMDDYFYPYPIKNAAGVELDFPDEPAWLAYLLSGGSLTKADWRRLQVNHLIESISRSVHQEKPWVKFGISPFGIGRPDRLPPGIAGFSQYDKLYADVELWLAKAWVDYLTPQLYWPVKQNAQAFEVLLDYWSKQNTRARHLWPGLFTSRIDQSEASWPVEEIFNQIDISRKYPNSGHVHFSMVTLQQDRRQIRTRLRAERYQTNALIPASPWLNSDSVPEPQLDWSADKKHLMVTLKNSPNVNLLAIWKRHGQHWIFSVQSSKNTAIQLPVDPVHGVIEQVVVSSIDRSGQESPRVNMHMN